MPSHAELYDYYCRRSSCHPNSSVTAALKRLHDGEALEVVDVSSNYLGQRGLIPVLDLVKNSKTVRTLDVSNNTMGEEQVRHLAYCLALHPGIRHVRLCSTGLNDGHADALLQLLSMNTSLEAVELDGNHLSPSVMARIASALRRNSAMQKQRSAEDGAHAAYLEAKAAKETCTRRSFTASLSGTISAAESGGYVHYATWWRNPQFSVKISRSSRVAFVLECTAADEAAVALAANQMGLMVLRHDGVHRALQITDTTVVAESAVAERRCTIHAHLDAAECYVVMPFTFNPGRALSFAITATMVNEHTAQEEGWVTLEPLDPKYDWCTHTVEGCWTAVNAGGSGSCTSWRRNDMYHITQAGADSPTASKQSTVAATLYVLLIKAADPYDTDERAIGVDVVYPDPRNAAAPPLFYASDVVCASAPHARTSFVLLKVTLPSPGVDLYVVPSTELAGQTGPYTLTVFSSLTVQLTTSAFPHGWRYRAINSAWDAACCGGCRAECPSWKNNPALEVRLEDAAMPLIACVELRPVYPLVEAADLPQEEEQTAAVAVSEEAARRTAELAAFTQRHRTATLEVGVMAVEPVAPTYPVVATSPQSAHAAAIVVCPARPLLYVVPMLRHAADVAAYTLELFSPAPFVVESELATCLAVRERQAQLAAYSAESERRAAVLQAAAQQAGTGASSSADASDTAALRAVRAEVAERRAATGLPFTDRDFPRGTSSLFLDPAGPPPLDFPAETTWQRASTLAVAPLSAGDEDLTAGVVPPYPEGPRQWFAAVLHAVAAKPGWLSRIFVCYDSAAGLAQFRFFKQDDWVGVTVDDFLVTDNHHDLVYGHSNDGSGGTVHGAGDLLYPLAEKAYAKLHRCYEALEPKVNPTQTTQQRLLQGLRDVTGGCTTVLRIRTLESSAEMSVEERDALWRRLKSAIEPTLLCSLLLDSGGAVTRERAHVGLLPDRLYGVVDARFVEQQRLVKLRLYSDADGADGWRGRWARQSARWTPTLRDVLHYSAEAPSAPSYEAWVHFDEVLYYFTHVFVTEVCARRVSVAGSFAEPLNDEPANAQAALRNPQFALDLVVAEGRSGASPAAFPASNTNANAITAAEGPSEAVVEVHIGLHRRDPRLDVTRTRGATARLTTGLGLVVFATDDNRRRLTAAEDDAVVQLVAPSTDRDVCVTLRLSADMLAGVRRLTIMPFRENLRDPDVAYALSACCAATAGVALRLSHVAANTSTVVAGRWGPAKAGGPDFPQWRNNPQFFLSATAEATEVTVTLRPVGTTTATLGFTLHRTRHCSSFLTFDAATVVASAVADVAGAAASCVVRLAGMAERRGMPYVLVPYVSSPSSAEGGDEFQIEVVANRPVQLRPIDPRLDWHRLQHTVSINAENGNAGGSLAFPSWRFNTQLILTFPVERDGRLFISARRLRSADPRVKVGMALLHAGSPVSGGFRRRLAYAEEDVVARSVDGVAEALLDTTVSLPRDSGALLLVVYADQPYKEAEVELSVYAAPTVELQPVQEWPAVSVQEGSWNLGTTAAGSRVNFASWINNPFFALSVLRPTRVTLLLVQYPRDHEHPVVRRHGNYKSLLPPPLQHPDRCTAIQLSVAKYNAALTEVVATAPTTCAETLVTVELGPEWAYFVVPCTAAPQCDGDFKLFAFADHPIDFCITEKPRLPYV